VGRQFSSDGNVVSFGKEPNQKKYLSAMVQLLEQYATQLFNNVRLVVSVHFDVTLCDV